MLRVACADIGIADCDFVAEGENVRKVENRFFDHLRDQYPEIIAGLADDRYRKLEHRDKEAIEHE